MSVWIDVCKGYPPYGEEVLVLYKDRKDELKHENLYYAIAHRCMHNFLGSVIDTWSTFTEYQSHYEVLYWARLYDMPIITEVQNDN